VKKADIATIILIASISTLIGYFILNAVLGDPSEETATVEYIDEISADISQPDPEVFNPAAINPTVEVIIGKDRPVDEAASEAPCEPGDAECIDSGE
jgi:hypothetical protein